MSSAADIYGIADASGWRPEPDHTVSEWSDTYRKLSGKASAEPGQWRTSRTPYLREIMDHLSPSHPTRRVVFMKGAQVGATECGNNWLGFIIHHAPGPSLMVQPTVDVARRVSKQRIDPMIDSTPVLRELVSESRSRDSGNTILVKEFPGGLLIMTGSNSGAGLRSMPIRNLFTDEIDEYPGDVDGQGDPVSLAEKRTTTFANRKVFLVSTPTIKGLSRIEREFLGSDQRRFFLPCPYCDAMDWLRWENIRWDEGKPETASLRCVSCSELIEEQHKTEMLIRGEWRALKPENTKTVGFHLSGLYSPIGWKSWSECVDEFLTSKDDTFKLKTWVNTILGETWEERGETVEPESILARRETYAGEVPNGVGVLVASVDVQDDRLECLVKGYGAGEESWAIAHEMFHGDPGHDSVWFALDRFLKTKFDHESGQRIPIECVTVDSGGHHTDTVYKFCKVRLARRIFAIRGGALRGAEVVGRPSNKNRYRVKLFTLCVDTAKDIIYSRLRVRTPGPAFMHYPLAPWLDEEFAAQLTAEKAIRKYVRGRGSVRQWIKLRERNEILDLEVYALAALYILGPSLVRSLPERARKFNITAAAADAEASRIAGEGRSDEPATETPRRQRRRSWVDAWRDSGRPR